MQSEKLEKLLAFQQKDPENTNLLSDIGNECLRIGLFDDALHHFAMLKEFGAAKAGRVGIARTLMAAHRFAEAVEELKALSQDEGLDGSLQMNLGIAYYHITEYASAVEQILSALQSGCPPLDAHRYLAYSFHHLGDLGNAILNGKEWALQAQSSVASAYLSLLLFDHGDRDSAREAASHAVASNGMEPDALTVLGGIAIEEERFSEAAQAFESVLGTRPEDGRAWLGRGLGLLHLRRVDEAIDALAQAVHFMPTHAGTVVTLGWAYLLGGNMAQAEEVFRDAIKLDRNFAEAHGGLSAALSLQQRHAEAAQIAAVADRLDANNFGGTYAKAIMLRATGDNQRADKLIRRALHAPVTSGLPAFSALQDIFLPR